MASGLFDEFVGKKKTSSSSGLFDEFTSKKTTATTKPVTTTKKKQNVGDVAKTLAGGLIRGLTSAGDVAASVGATIGTAAGKKIGAPLLKKVMPGLKGNKAVESFAKRNIEGLTKETKLGDQTLFSPKAYTSPRQAVGEIGEAAFDLGSNLLTGGIGAGAVKSVAKTGLKQLAKQELKNLATKQTAKAILADFTLGAGTGAFTTLQNESAKASDILKGALLTGSASAALPFVAGGLFKGARAGKREVVDALVSTRGETIKSLERFANKAVNEGFKDKKALQNIGLSLSGDNLPYEMAKPRAQTVIESGAQKAADLLKSTEGFSDTIMSQMQRYSPIGRIFERNKVGGARDVQTAFEMMDAKGYGEAQARVMDRAKAIDTATRSVVGNDPEKNLALRTAAERRLKMADAIDLVTNGKKVEGDYDLETLTKGYKDFVASMNPEIELATRKVIDEVKRFNDELLDEEVALGIISQASADAMRQSRANYFPHRVIEYTEGLKKADNQFISPNKTKVKETKFAEGSTKAIENPLQAQFTAAADRLVRIERQKAQNKFWDAIESDPKVKEDLGITRVISTDTETPDGFAKVSRMKNGEKEEYILPEILADAYKGGRDDYAVKMSRVLSDTTIGRIITLPSRFLRSAAVTNNPVFKFFTNPMRDIATVSQTTDATLNDILQGYMGVFLKNTPNYKEVYEEAARGGAFMGNLFREGRKPADVTQEIFRKAEILNRGLTMDQIKGSPAKVAQDVWNHLSDTFENGARLAAYRAAIRKGSNPSEAAAIAANSTVDFNKNGNLTKLVNQVVPFFNAATQGSLNLSKALNEDPVKFARKLTRQVIIPQIALNEWNMNYDSYWNISDSERKNKWIIMTGESPSEDYEGNPTMVPHYIALPKMETQVLVGSAIERVMGNLRDRYPQDFKNWLMETGTAVSPIDGPTSFIPTAALQYQELTSNYSNFRKAPIIPEWVPIGKDPKTGETKWVESKDLDPRYQYNPQTTSEVSKFVGDMLNVSPAKLDYVLKVGALNELFRTIDLAIRTGDKETDSMAALRDRPLWEQLSEAPFLRAVVKSSPSGEFLQKRELEREEAKKEANELLKKIRNIKD